MIRILLSLALSVSAEDGPKGAVTPAALPILQGRTIREVGPKEGKLPSPSGVLDPRWYCEDNLIQPAFLPAWEKLKAAPLAIEPAKAKGEVEMSLEKSKGPEIFFHLDEYTRQYAGHSSESYAAFLALLQCTEGQSLTDSSLTSLCAYYADFALSRARNPISPARQCLLARAYALAGEIEKRDEFLSGCDDSEDHKQIEKIKSQNPRWMALFHLGLSPDPVQRDRYARLLINLHRHPSMAEYQKKMSELSGRAVSACELMRPEKLLDTAQLADFLKPHPLFSEAIHRVTNSENKIRSLIAEGKEHEIAPRLLTLPGQAPRPERKLLSPPIQRRLEALEAVLQEIKLPEKADPFTASPLWPKEPTQIRVPKDLTDASRIYDLLRKQEWQCVPKFLSSRQIARNHLAENAELREKYDAAFGETEARLNKARLRQILEAWQKGQLTELSFAAELLELHSQSTQPKFRSAIERAFALVPNPDVAKLIKDIQFLNPNKMEDFTKTLVTIIGNLDPGAERLFAAALSELSPDAAQAMSTVLQIETCQLPEIAQIGKMQIRTTEDLDKLLTLSKKLLFLPPSLVKAVVEDPSLRADLLKRFSRLAELNHHFPRGDSKNNYRILLSVIEQAAEEFHRRHRLTPTELIKELTDAGEHSLLAKIYHQDLETNNGKVVSEEWLRKAAFLFPTEEKIANRIYKLALDSGERNLEAAAMVMLNHRRENARTFAPHLIQWEMKQPPDENRRLISAATLKAIDPANPILPKLLLPLQGTPHQAYRRASILFTAGDDFQKETYRGILEYLTLLKPEEVGSSTDDKAAVISLFMYLNYSLSKPEELASFMGLGLRPEFPKWRHETLKILPYLSHTEKIAWPERVNLIEKVLKEGTTEEQSSLLTYFERTAGNSSYAKLLPLFINLLEKPELGSQVTGILEVFQVKERLKPYVSSLIKAADKYELSRASLIHLAAQADPEAASVKQAVLDALRSQEPESVRFGAKLLEPAVNQSVDLSYAVHALDNALSTSLANDSNSYDEDTCALIA